MKTLIATIALACFGCGGTSSVHNSKFQLAEPIWVVQTRSDADDQIVYCDKNRKPVCTRVWNGATEVEHVPDNPYVAKPIREIDQTYGSH